MRGVGSASHGEVAELAMAVVAPASESVLDDSARVGAARGDVRGVLEARDGDELGAVEAADRAGAEDGAAAEHGVDALERDGVELAAAVAALQAAGRGDDAEADVEGELARRRNAE